MPVNGIIPMRAAYNYSHARGLNLLLIVRVEILYNMLAAFIRQKEGNLMELSSMAQWLNSAFAGYDKALLSVLHSAAEAAGGFLTPLMKLITLLGEKGLLFLLLAVGLMCFARTRRVGLCIFGAVCCGALITNIVLKDLVARPRPFESVELYRQWWAAVGSPAEDGFSFPSGHVTAAAAGMSALCFMRGKKLILPSVLVVFLMGVSRNYLVAHYPSDVLAAIMIGLLSGLVAWVITKLIFRFLEEHRAVPFFAFLLDFDLSPAALRRGGYQGKHQR